MLSWFARITGTQKSQSLDTLADKIAHRCRPLVVGRIADLLTGMNTHETRGYVRAQSSPEVRRAVDAALRQTSHTGSHDRNELVSATIERLVLLVVHDVNELNTAPQHDLRRAA